MRDEFVDFAKYCGASLTCKIVAYYIVPSVVLGLTFYDEVSYTYLFYAITLFSAGNFLVQLFFGPRYKGQVIAPSITVSFRLSRCLSELS